MEDWPWDLCRIDFDRYRRGRDPAVRRTPFEDGAVEQAKTQSLTYRVQSFRIHVKDSNVKAMEAWLERHETAHFNYRDFIDEEVKTARLRGGAGSVTLVAVDGVLWENERVFQGEVTLEYLV